MTVKEGGKPNSGTSKDMRKSENNTKLTRNRPTGAGAGRKSPGSGKSK